jgi:hypothetical protein
MRKECLEQMRAHVDDGGGLTHRNAIDLLAAVERLRAALDFYADPLTWKRQHDPRDDIPIPDFYSELSFGDRARDALNGDR